MNKNIEHPSHYNQGKIECLDALAECLSCEELRGFIKGNVIKYLWREGSKNGDEDLKKALFYLQWYLKEEDKAKSSATTEAIIKRLLKAKKSIANEADYFEYQYEKQLEINQIQMQNMKELLTQKHEAQKNFDEQLEINKDLRQALGSSTSIEMEAC